MDFKYKVSFSSIVKPLIAADKDHYLSIASLANLKPFLPEIDPANVDLLPVAFNGFLSSRANKNDDITDSDTSIAIANLFINKPINSEHNRSKVIGVILTAGFTEFGTDKVITAEEAKALKSPFNVTFGGVVWRIVDRDLASLIEDSADPSSLNYQDISASFELGFNEYDIVVVEGKDKNLINSKQIITDAAEIEKLSKSLKGFGGSGQISANTYIYRKINNPLPLGIGFTKKPAADVKGILTPQDTQNIELVPANSAEIPTILQNKEKSEETVSQSINPTVNQNSIIMKITNIQDITDDALKQAKAADIHEFVSQELDKAAKKFVQEKAEKETALKTAEANLKTLAEESAKVKEELTKIKADFQKLQTEAEDKKKTEVFNTRMAGLDATYELANEDRQIIATDINGLSDEAFAAYEKKSAVLLKEKNKEVIKKKATEAAAKITAVASTTTPAATVETAVTNATPTTTVVPATPSATTSLKEKFAAAFSNENVTINLGRK